MPRNICARCHRFVYQPEEKCAFGKVWHSFCFSCYICNRLLDCTNAQTAKEQLYCVDCFFKPSKEDDDDQCPSERCIRSLSSKPRSSEDLKVSNNVSNIQSTLKTCEAIYPCTIPVPHSISAWYNRQHRRRLPPTKQVFCVPSFDSCISGVPRGRKGGRESECTCSRSYTAVNQEVKPDTASEGSVKCKRNVNFERSKKEQKEQTPKPPKCCVSKVSETLSQQSEEYCDGSCVLKQKKAFSTTQNVDCCCASFTPIAAIKKALQQAVTAATKPKNCSSKTSNLSCRRVRSRRQISLGGGLDCRRCGRKVYFAEMFTVPGAVYHDTCFCCLDCRKPLEITTVYPTQGDIYCKLCYIRCFGPLGYGYGIGPGVLLSPNP